MNKKKILLTFVITLVLVLVIVGGIAVYVFTRENEVIELNAEDVTVNTLVVNDEGTIQSALVETFDKDYYKIDELKDFVKDDLKKYNKANDTNVSLLDAKKNGDKAVLVYHYATIEDYSKYNEVKAYMFSPKEALKDERVPSNLKEYEGSDVPKDSIYDDEKLITVVIEADTELIVNGKIKYYSGCEVTSENKVVAKSGERAVVVFK